jgi:hypothetical protein
MLSVTSRYAIATCSSMALPTVLAFCVLSLSLVMASLDHG